MSARQSLRIAFFSLLAFTLQATYVAPARAMDTLRAAHCCATRCHHAQSTTAANRCCHVEQDAADVARLSAVKGVHPQVTATPLFTPVTAAYFANLASFANDSSPHSVSRATPIFLFTRSLRL